MKVAKTVKGKRRKINKKFRMAILTLAFLMMAGVSITVYSKYYKTKDNMGMAVASGFYFSSDYMAELTLDENDDIKNLTMEAFAQKYENSIIASTRTWNGSETTFQVSIRNYDSMLLYNDKDLNVEYAVKFMLLDEPKGATYQVSYDGTVKSLGWTNGKGDEAVFPDSDTLMLAGGGTQSHAYDLKITPVAGADYVPSRILMVAYPTGPDYLTNARKCIAGILKAEHREGEFQILDSGFEIVDTQEYKDSLTGSDTNGWEKIVDKESGFKYQVITSGSYNASSIASKRKIKLTWNNNIFKIDQNNIYYQKTQAGEDEKEGSFSVDETTRQATMEIEVFPYALLEFVFFRGNEFIIDNMERSQFEDAITVDIIPEEIVSD